MSEEAPDSSGNNSLGKPLLHSIMTSLITGETLVQEHIISRGLTLEDLRQQQPSNDVLLKLSKELDNWVEVGFNLNISKSEIKAIKVDNHSEEERRIFVLAKWKEKNGDSATYYNLIEALNDSDRVDLIDQALDALKEGSLDLMN